MCVRSRQEEESHKKAFFFLLLLLLRRCEIWGSSQDAVVFVFKCESVRWAVDFLLNHRGGARVTSDPGPAASGRAAGSPRPFQADLERGSTTTAATCVRHTRRHSNRTRQLVYAKRRRRGRKMASLRKLRQRVVRRRVFNDELNNEKVRKQKDVGALLMKLVGQPVNLLLY